MKNEIIKYKGHDIEIFPDDYPESPNDWHNEDQFIVYDHRDLTVERDGFDPQDIFNFVYKNNWKLYNGYYAFPLYAYIHSGIVLSVGSHNFPDAQFDVSFKGFVLIKRERGSYTSLQAFKAAKRLTNVWNDYLEGNVWGYFSDAGSCSGYYGYNGKEHMIEEAKEEIDTLLILNLRDRFKKVKTYIRHHVPLHKRELPELIV